jgi:monoamine oxidase
VLEARDRIGGRSYSITDSAAPWDFEHDLGGTFQHGSSKANSISWLPDRFGIKRTLSGGDSAYVGEADKAVYIRGTDGSLYEQSDVQLSFQDFDKWWRACTAFLRERVSQNDLRDINLKYVSEYIFESVMDPLTETQQALLDHHVTLNFDEDWGINHALWPLVGFDENDGFWWRPINGEDNVLPGGMGQILELLHKGDPLSPAPLDIYHQHVVINIEHGTGGCTVTYYIGGNQREVFTESGSACLVTIPLAVLAGTGDAEGDIVFEPELSAPKQIAIRTRGISHLNFAVALFEYPFWREVDPDKTSWRWVDSRQSCDRELGEEFSYFTEWLDLSAFKEDDKHYYLQSFVGSDKYHIESLNDNQLKAIFVNSLERYYGTGNVPNPIGFKMTRWTSDSFARSAYSGLWVRSTDQEWYDLARPESLSLYFAGEHTNYDGRYQSIDGAYNTGTREAERIAARSWNAIDGVSQSSDWMNPFAYSSGWDDEPSSRLSLKQKGNGNGKPTKIHADPKLYKVDRATRLGLKNMP